ncbi:NADP-dependent oxidoreductase [Labedaea rhizosphaerae]|uniref:Enoyl reductase (ER) domain-containing protein n=1 Tax=Labedaea rhizosphaerae TaxID=598644 RepID=A0A4R6S8W9_LABRH|nr:NADP-dependent oxidoreductase [Labedaea rhizosphaerae]TDP96439.1 hypothetical protein EV186_104427 [Labedaea rhizosphaerae]
MASTYTAVRQVRRPHRAPSPDDFTFVTGPVPDPADGQVVVRNLYLSVDPYMRELMDEGGWERGFGLEGRALGRVIASAAPALPVGATVFHRDGWSTHAVLDAADARPVDPPDGIGLSAYLGLLGGTGLTAYVGLTKIAQLRPGEDLFISSAAGGVGSAAGQLARLLGAGRVVGSAGSPGKVEHLTGRLGFDAAFDHHAGPIAEQLKAVAPQGIDVYFDNVGGDHLAAAIGALRKHGRVAWCGAIAQYNNPDDPPAAPANLYDVVHKALRIEGFLVRDHLEVRPEFEQFVIPHLLAGRVFSDETVVDGFERIVEAFLGMLRGSNTGKTLVRLD